MIIKRLILICIMLVMTFIMFAVTGYDYNTFEFLVVALLYGIFLTGDKQ